MTPNFALSLSFEGIELLQRVQHGWKRVGRADVEDENLDAVLADLRAKAEALSPDGFCTKLIIPLDQIKYVAIDSTQTTDEDIEAELDGATPYGLNELVIDCERFGGRTHIAAVARETLIEAETFANAHGFNPVSFVAVPEPFTFQKEVFFGPTSMMRDFLGWDGEVERDPLPVMVVGTRIKSRLLVFDLPEEVIPPSDDTLDLTEALPAREEAEAPKKPNADEPPSMGFDLAAALAPFADDAPAETDPPKAAEASGGDKEDEKSEGFDLAATLAPFVEETPAANETAKIDDVADDGEEDPEPELPLAAEVAPIEESGATALEADEPAPVAAEPTEQPAAAPELPQEEAPAEPPSPVIVDTIIPETATPEPAAPPAPVAEMGQPLHVPIPDDLALYTPRLLDTIIAEYHKPKLRKSRRQRSRLIALAPPTQVAATKIPAPPPRPIPIPQTANDNRRPRMIAGAIAASLVVVGVVAWAMLRETEGATTPEEPTAIAVEEALQEATAIPSQTTDEDLVGPAPALPQLDVATLTAPADEDVTNPAFPPVDAAQTQTDLPQALAGAATPDAALPPVEPAPAPPAEEQATATVGAPILRGRVLSPADAARIYAATGVWQRAPRFVDVPGTTSTAGMIVPTSETMPERLARPEAPLTDDLATDLSFLAPADPPPPETTFALDEDGFVLATSEGAVTPEGAIVFAGAPDLEIQLRPTLSAADLERMALLAPAPEDVVIVAGRPDIVPPLRPADAALPTDDSVVANADATAEEQPTPGGVALSALATEEIDPTPSTARPELRPSDFASTARPTDPGTPDITAIIAGIEAEETEATANAIVNATSQAVAASLRPTERPNNFNQVVAAARAQIERQQSTAAPAAAPVQTAAPVAPQNYAPVPGGVARAATQDDVIRLREMNLIGVYGRPNARRALVRLSNGRYVRVEVGSALDGGQVTAIGESALNYVKRGRTYALELPSG
ncbi:hypothetical protein SLH49_09915 [Cognatiyoonia sp. IB215446]|uniref:hypothetical protein n=1 Tax=Cognatiyoonia sp. IB215446 TaxID=3097355 RepID=UPI002A0EB177|nr:hypothetical protein [Cognatiyoonia sp. IB215446]MDX8348304.1 hypothetical protein [Cognatiyoonia sp. IB215446]